MRPALGLLALLALPALVLGPPAVASVAPGGFEFLRGDLHAHTCYSDGHGSAAEAFAAGRGAGLDFFAVTEHAEWLAFPFCAREECIGTPVACYMTPLPARTEWDDVLAAADAATAADGSFIGLRGFEWSHPILGHVNVLGSARYTDSLTTPAMAPLYAWLLAPPPAGGSDGVASFNHPGREPLMFDGFQYVAPADAELQLLEVYNRGDSYQDEYLQALDKGWHVAPTGVSDGHGVSAWQNVRGLTVVLAGERSRAGILGALEAMRTFATNDRDVEVVFRVGSALMGSTVDTGDSFQADIQVADPTPLGGLATVTVLTTGGQVVAQLDAGGAASVDWKPDLTRPPGAGEAWFVVKVETSAGGSAFTAPIWTT